MCLFTVQDKPFVAENDIVCFKRLVLYKNNRFVTPVIGRKIKNAVISGKRLYRARGIFRRAYIDPVFRWVTIVDRGWIHTYTNKPYFFKNENTDIVWFECVIPKGTKCWKSIDGKTYASSYIRFIKPCEEQIRALFSERMGRFPVEDELSVIVGSIEQTKKFFKAFA